MFDVAIIGGGFSGTSLACQLSSDLSCIIFEKAEDKLGKGLAYGINSPYAILNVTAERMGLFERAPLDFFNWLQSRRYDYSKDSFVPRKIYGEYLLDRLNSTNTAKNISEVTSIKRGAGYYVINDSVRAKNVVLATGNTESNFISGRRVISISSLLNGAEIHGSKVCIIGSSLSAHDAVAELKGRGFKGEIILVSRHGLSPKLHSGHNHATLEPDRGSLRTLSRSVIASLRSSNDWRAEIDSLRPLTQTLWNELSEKEKEVFLRRLKTYWDIHRHRIPPESAHELPTLKGHVIGVNEQGDLVAIQFSNRPEIIVDYVIDATGVSWREGNSLILKLCREGLAQVAFVGGGIRTTTDGRVIDGEGNPNTNLFAIGPIRRGDLLETTAVREIRSQAFNLASFFSQDLKSSLHSHQERT